MKTTTVLAATAALLVLPTTAMASTNTSKNISVCTDKIMTQLDANPSDAQLDFKTVKGNSRLQTLNFRIQADGTRDKVTCKVRRDDTVEIVWGKKVKPSKVLTVKVEDTSSAGE